VVAIEALTAVMVFKILKIHRYLERFHFFACPTCNWNFSIIQVSHLPVPEKYGKRTYAHIVIIKNFKKIHGMKSAPKY